MEESNNKLNKIIFNHRIIKEIRRSGIKSLYLGEDIITSNQYLISHLSYPSEKTYNWVLEKYNGDRIKTDEYFKKKILDFTDEFWKLHEYNNSYKNTLNYLNLSINKEINSHFYDIYFLIEEAQPLEVYLENKLLTLNDIFNLGMDVSKALLSFHDDEIIYSNLKIENIYVSKYKSFYIDNPLFLQLLDIKDIDLKESSYLSPDFSKNINVLDSSSDTYALSVVLYEILNFGKNPFLDLNQENPSFNKKTNIGLNFENSVTLPLPAQGTASLGNLILKTINNNEFDKEKTKLFLDKLIKIKKDHSYDSLKIPILSKTDNFEVKNSQLNRKNLEVTRTNEQISNNSQKQRVLISLPVNSNKTLASKKSHRLRNGLFLSFILIALLVLSYSLLSLTNAIPYKYQWKKFSNNLSYYIGEDLSTLENKVDNNRIFNEIEPGIYSNSNNSIICRVNANSIIEEIILKGESGYTILGLEPEISYSEASKLYNTLVEPSYRIVSHHYIQEGSIYSGLLNENIELNLTVQFSRYDIKLESVSLTKVN